MKISELIRNSKLSTFQLTTIIVAMALTVLEGYDSALLVFTAPYVRHDFNASLSEVGALVSASLIGMVIGSIVVAPIADRIGRRGIAIVGSLVVTVGMIWAAFCGDVPDLFCARILTGLGLGGMLSVVGVTAAEYSNGVVYRFVMAVYAAGINIGAVAGALGVGPILDATHNWRDAFYIGIGLSVVAVIMSIVMFPESVSWLAMHRSPKSLERLNVILKRMGHEPLKDFPPDSDTPKAAQGAVRTVFSGRLLGLTLLMMVGYLAFMFVFYFMNSFAPTMVTQLNPLNGVPNAALAPSTTMSLALGGIAGTLVFGLVATKINPRILTPIFLIVGLGGVIWFGYVLTHIPAAYYELFMASFFFSAGVAGFYQIIPALYPVLARSTGNGIILGVGRIGGIVAPILAGVAADNQMAASTMFTLFASPLIISALTVVILAAIEANRRRHGIAEVDSGLGTAS